MTTPALVRKSLHVTTAALPLAGWTAHALVMHRRLTAAHRDPLTGAWRRDAFTTRAQRFLERHDDALVLMADLDNFKQINDRYGHAAGDAVLAAASARLIEWAGPRGLVGRLGGDEFVAATRITDRHREMRLDQLVHLLALPIAAEDVQLHVGVSIGTACPDAVGGACGLVTLMRAADAAMYAGKHSGRIVQAGPQHADAASINGRRVGRPGTHVLGRAA